MSSLRSLFYCVSGYLLSLGFLLRGKRVAEQEQIALLKNMIEKSPYWQAGHAQITRLYLRAGQVDKAYFAAQTFRTLAGSEHWESAYLLGVCYLRSGDLTKAEQTLATALEKYPHRHEVREEYAAALIGQGAYERAIPIIEAIPAENRSPQLLAALDACRAALRS